jgi:N-acetylglucosaminyldiphosphoundecaprenol N-acetyl-beta-D-mannosaminyltransferase
VTLGYPRRERLIRVMIDRWPAGVPYPLFAAVGASFEMLFGLKKQAPLWVRRAGLEWFFRFVQEPRRLFRRYFIDDMAFFPLVWREWRRTRRSAR